MNGMRVLRQATRADQRIETSKANLATAFHAPEGGGTAQRCENRDRSVDSHDAECQGATLGLGEEG